ncbi:MAG TPA: hypothetical protein VGO96_16805 [Pyrinomonadaceae bacterium]|nr:hypothetical protein [Pyrinomonadaceae bacterium]
MRVLSICLRASLLAVAVTCLSAVASGQQVLGYPANTSRADRTPQGRYPSSEGDGPGSIPDPGRMRNTRDSVGRDMRYPYPRTIIRWPAERNLTKEQKQKLYPSATEKATFAAILREDGTGMTRLLPFCDVDPRVLDVRGSCADGLPRIPGRGAFYSFKTENHEAKGYSDLALNSNEFRVGFAQNAVGTITTLGDVPLEELTLESSAVAPLLLLAPAKTLYEMVGIYEQSRSVLASAHHAYGTTAPAQPNTTYVLRSTMYNQKGRKPNDVIIAFRVTRQDTDGSVTILWKELRTPKS